MKKFQPLEALPETKAELDAYTGKIRAAINVFQARAANGEEFEADDVAELEALNAEFTKADTKLTEITAEEQSRAERLDAALAAANAATAPKPEPEAPAAPAEEAPVEVPAEAAAEVVAEAEAAVADAAAPAAVTAAAPEPVKFEGAVAAGELPKPEEVEEPRKPFILASTAPNFAEYDGQFVDTDVIAEGIANKTGEFTGLRSDGPTILARMERPQGTVVKDYKSFVAERARLQREIPGHGKVTAQALVAAGGWCAPSERSYAFEGTQPAVGLLSFPEMHFPRGGIIINDEPDFSPLQNGFYFTEAELEADSGSPNFTPTAIKDIVEIPCPEDTIEYRLEALGWGIKTGILQKRAYPELIKKFLDEFLVRHEQRKSEKSLFKVLQLSSSAKVVPNDVVLGATTGILNGLHMRAWNIQQKTRKPVVEGIAPLWFREVLRADLAGRSGLDSLSVTRAQVDAWLAERGIFLQYEGRWQALTTGKPGHEDTSWWPGSVDVVLYPAGTFWRVLDRVLTVGVEHDIDMLSKNRELVAFIEDEFQVGKTAQDPSHLIRIPLCVNGAVGAREHIDCSTEYAQTITKSVSLPGSPTSGSFTLKFGPLGIPSATLSNTATAANFDTVLTGIDDGVTAAGDIVTSGGALPAAVTVTYPARLGDLQVGTSTLAGGTSQTVSIS